VKSYMQMILRGVSYLHDTQWLLHRDLKPSNVLIADDGVVKLADFGFARNFGSPNASLTPLVVTRWYRCPELLFNATQYTGAIDIWSVGCIFAELMLRTPLFPAETDIEQLRLIFRLRGTPTEETWPGHTSLPTYIPFKPSQPKEMKQIFVAAGADALDLLDRCLALDPAKRCTAQEALDHDYFSALPVPTHPQELPRPERVSYFYLSS
jgi:cyclin-dependent kinase 7